MMTITRELQIELARHNAGITRARREAYREYIINPTCRDCTPDATCRDCKYRARRLLRVATSEDECATLLDILDQPSPFAAQCGTDGGHRAHGRRGDQPCRPCLDAHNARRNQPRREDAV